MPNGRRRGKPLANNAKKPNKNPTGSELRAFKRECSKAADEALTDIFNQLRINKDDFPKEYARLKSYAVEMNRPLAPSVVERNKANYQREIQSLVEKAKWLYFPKEAAAEALLAKQQKEHESKDKERPHDFSDEDDERESNDEKHRSHDFPDEEAFEEFSVDREFVIIEDP